MFPCDVILLFPSLPLKVMVEPHHRAAAGGVPKTAVPTLDGQFDAASGKNRLESRCSLS